MDLPQKKLGVTMNGSIELEYEILEDKDKVIAEICKAASKADEIYLAPDPDREGEIIAWHIGEQIKKAIKDPSRIHRITFNEITKTAVLEAINNPHNVDLKKVAAQQARRVLDRWVGYEVSPVLWQKIKKGLSAGRVQSVALRLIVDREEAIRAFKPEEYWTIEGLFSNTKDKFQAELTHYKKKALKLGNAEQVKKAEAALSQQQFSIEDIVDKKRNKNPYPPFITSTLQQAAYNKLGFSVKKTMQVAQKLYEGIPLDDASTPVALITYMRTDSLRIADSALKQARDFIKKQYDTSYLPAKANMYVKGGTSQDAHEAVRPIDVSLTPEKISRFLAADEAKLYKLIWQRFVACQMTSAEYAQRQVVVQGGDFTFKVTGSTLLFDGFLRVYASEEEEKEQKVVIPSSLEKGQAVTLEKTTPTQHFTQAPPRYTEASLVKELEKEGIGRPSTYSAILSTIQARAYTTLDQKKRFVPTDLGMAVTKLLIDNLAKIMDTKFTAHMEEDLDKIAKGDIERDKLLREFYGEFSEELGKFKGTTRAKRAPELTNIMCPSCQKHHLAIRFGARGEFLGCTGYPECSFTANYKRDESGNIIVEQPVESAVEGSCPNCGKPLRQARSKFGTFISCSGYPECKYIQKNVANFPCPQDGGEITERSWKGGKFWGCGNYPKCKFAIFSDIEQTPCPQCKQSPYLLKRVTKKATVLSCPNKECGYKQEIPNQEQ